MAANSISRRKLICHAPLAAVAVSLPTVVAVSDSPLVLQSVARHRQAYRDFENNCWRDDRLAPQYNSDTPENNERIFWSKSNAEEAAFDDLLNAPVNTIADLRAKSGYLLDYVRRQGTFEDNHIEELLSSMV